MTTKRFLTGLVALALILSAPGAFAASANASTTVSLAVTAYAQISVTVTTNLTGSTGPGTDYTGTTTVTFSCRTSKSGGTGDISLQATANVWNPNNGASGPALSDLKYTSAAGTYAGPGTYIGAAATVPFGSTAYVVSGLGANNKVTNQTVLTTFRVTDNAAWDAETYTIPVQFTLTAL